MINKTDMVSHQNDKHKEEAEFEEWFGGIFLKPGPDHNRTKYGTCYHEAIICNTLLNCWGSVLQERKM